MSSNIVASNTQKPSGAGGHTSARKVDPLDFIPAKLQRYYRYPWGLLAVWLGIALIISMLPASPASDAGSSVSENTSVASEAGSDAASSGKTTLFNYLGQGAAAADNFELDDYGTLMFVASGRMRGARVMRPQTSKFTVVDEFGTVLVNGEFPDGDTSRLQITDLSGSELYSVKFEDEETKIYTPDGNKILRLKLKEDKVNIYGPSSIKGGEQRMYHGKYKDGAMVIRNESDNVLARINFDGSVSTEARLQQTGILGLPLPLECKLLLVAVNRWR